MPISRSTTYKEVRGLAKNKRPKTEHSTISGSTSSMLTTTKTPSTEYKFQNSKSKMIDVADFQLDESTEIPRENKYIQGTMQK